MKLLCRKIREQDRKSELLDAIQQKTETVVERNQSVTGYATAIGFFAHAIAESNNDLTTLMATLRGLAAPGSCSLRGSILPSVLS